MPLSQKPKSVFSGPALALTAGLALAGLPEVTEAGSSFYKKRSGLVAVDVETGEVLLQQNKDLRIHPASLAKLGLAGAVAVAIETGLLSPSERVRLSSHAASQPGSRSRPLPRGPLSVNSALAAALITSQNKAATALGEHLARTAIKNPRFAFLGGDRRGALRRPAHQKLQKIFV